MPAVARAIPAARGRETACPDPGQLDLLRALFDAAADYGWQEKELAFALGYDQPYLSRIKSGEKTLPIGRLERLPRDLRRCLWTRLATDDGLAVTSPSTEAQVLGQVLEALGTALTTLGTLPRPRAARARLHDHPQQETPHD